jgi:hypothetical protein
MKGVSLSSDVDSFIGCFECENSPSVLATKVLNQLWVLFGEALHLLVESGTNAGLKKDKLISLLILAI